MIMQLVDSGFNYSEILHDMTIDEVSLFYSAAHRQKNKNIVEKAFTIRSAQHADVEGFKNFMDLFDKKETKPKEKKIDKPGDLETIAKLNRIQRLLNNG